VKVNHKGNVYLHQMPFGASFEMKWIIAIWKMISSPFYFDASEFLDNQKINKKITKEEQCYVEKLDRV